MTSKSDLRKVVNVINVSKAKSVHGLSDGHIYIDIDPEFLQKLALENDLEIYTFKGNVIEKIVSKSKSDKK